MLGHHLDSEMLRESGLNERDSYNYKNEEEESINFSDLLVLLNI